MAIQNMKHIRGPIINTNHIICSKIDDLLKCQLVQIDFNDTYFSEQITVERRITLLQFFIQPQIVEELFFQPYCKSQ